ncbi:RNA-directed DNA polymerase, eukaryota, reverse transcriptase zinc-binding domain protein, partial [Tanacetum coccineum]
MEDTDEGNERNVHMMYEVNNEMSTGKQNDDVSNGEGGGSANKSREEFLARETDFPLLIKATMCNTNDNSSEGMNEVEEILSEVISTENIENRSQTGMNINLTSSNFCNNTSKINDNECSVDKVGYKTYAKIVAPNDSENDNKLSLIPMCIEEGREVVVFDEEIVREGSRKWALTLCGHFVGCKMSYFELRESKGMSYVLENGPWMVNNKPLMVQKCELDVVIDRSEPKSLTCWIKLHNIPLEAWTSKGISAIASGLDKPLIMDKTTTMICKGRHGNYGYARVLVEIQVDKEFKDVVEICYKSNHQRTKCSKFVNVEYSWKPPKCCKCKVFGHDD